MLTHYHHSVSNKLLLEIKANRLCYVIANRSFQIVHTGHYAFSYLDDLKAVIAEDSLFAEIFSTIDIIYGDADYVLLPQHLLTKSDAHHLFKLHHTLPYSKKLLEGNLNREISILFSIPTEMSDYFNHQFPSATQKHHTEFQFNWLLEKYKLVDDTIFLFFEFGRLNIFAFKKDKLVLLNSYLCPTIGEIFYFTMAIIEQVELELEKLTLVWIGTIEGGVELVRNTFNDFVPNIELKSQLVKIKTNHQLGLGIQSILACESYQEV